MKLITGSPKKITKSLLYNTSLLPETPYQYYMKTCGHIMYISLDN